MKKNLFFAFLFLSFSCFSQNDFYHPDTIQEIKIYFAESNWNEILDDLYVAGDKDRMFCDIEINGTRIDSVGIRYKGFSSVSTNRAKNPFNIKLDYLKPQFYDGIDKIKLSNVIQDPSFIREVLSYEIGRKYMPASRANFAKVFINDQYWGLYTNVESVDENFLGDNYGTVDGSFFKCNPDDLDLDGENSNLSNSPGMDSTNYKPLYDKESKDGWGDLLNLIDVLNEEPDNIESVLNVDRTLWMHAFNYSLINFDSYVGYAQNYYLYKESGVFNPILWDLNQSFASYRLTDASEHFDGFSIAQAKTMDPLLHSSSVSIQPRPLMRNLFENDTYRRMYLAHMRTIMEENFDNGAYKTRGQALQDLIDSSVETDVNKFYGYDDFKNNLTETVSDLVEYPGIFDLMDARSDFLKTYPGFEGAPDISNINSAPSALVLGGDVTITATIAGAENVILGYRSGGNSLFEKLPMFDDGMHGDGSANDNVFGATIQNTGNQIQYYFYAENEDAGRFSPERAAFEYYTLISKINADDIVINEFMASNDGVVLDEAGDSDDWIELYNTSNFDISTGGLYLSDKTDRLDKFALPDVVIPADGYLIVWADEDGSQGDLHANFKLSSGGETISLSYADGTVINSTTYTDAETDLSFARKPNGTGDFQISDPTFGGNNDFTNVEDFSAEAAFRISPNPTRDFIFIKNLKNKSPNLIKIHDLNGSLHLQKTEALDGTDIKISTSNLAEGVYLISVFYNDLVRTERFVKF